MERTTRLGAQQPLRPDFWQVRMRSVLWAESRERLPCLVAGWSHRAAMPRGAVRPAAGRSWLTWGRSLWLWLVGRALAGGCGHGADGQRRDGRNFVVMAMAGSGWSPGEGRRRWRGACFPATSSPGCRRARSRDRSRWRKERGRLTPGSGRRTRWRRQGCGGRVARHVTAPRSRLEMVYNSEVHFSFCYRILYTM